MFGATNLVKNSDKEKQVYSGYGMAFDRIGTWNSDNGDAWNVIILGVDNSSSHTDNHKNNFLVLGEGPTYCINGSFCTPEKKLSIE